ncbi:unnamed protein product [Acanthoscelides obtectus]|uniref:Uncharacterized protein n=1 Tax=Acanthoscelides obtectus TaxID=200917 RepID=A0A9P0PMH0_ACAOB|nr:unnamed protein product [Acanthoscelides obtectus]CAK1629612.1 hypothetical protein AOBTE_LOCUS5848 [Acanthoscelides obtectus]
MVKPNFRNPWAPAVPLRRADNITSSKAKEQNTPVFKPAFEQDKRHDMWMVMSNGYGTQWFKEKAVYEKETYFRWETIKQEKKVKRRTVQRMMTYRQPTRIEYLEKYVIGYKKNCRKSVYLINHISSLAHKSGIIELKTQVNKGKARGIP